MKKIWTWGISFIVTLIIAVFQRTTGPTYPVKDNVNFAQEKINFKLRRSHSGNDDELIKIMVKNKDITGIIKWKYYRVNQDLKTISMKRKDKFLYGYLPGQPVAGKLEYDVILKNRNRQISLTNGKFVVIRFRGKVPWYFLVSHILFMFLAILFCIQTFIEIFTSNRYTRQLAFITFIMIVLGGFIFGSIVQLYAFGVAWAGFPLGSDLTDNKTLIALLLWIFALWMGLNRKDTKISYLVAAVGTIIVYFIPHSLFGSELDYSKIINK